MLRPDQNPYRAPSLLEVVGVLAMALLFFVILGLLPVRAADLSEKGVLYSRNAVTSWYREFTPIPERVQVIDGDTIRYNYRPERHLHYDIRLYGGDAPELHVPCEKERALASKNRLAALLHEGHIKFKIARQKDRYGRAIGIVAVENRSVMNVLISEGHARPYLGGRRDSWCAHSETGPLPPFWVGDRDVSEGQPHLRVQRRVWSSGPEEPDLQSPLWESRDSYRGGRYEEEIIEIAPGVY